MSLQRYKPGDPTRIFVVEDDPMYLRMIKFTMELNPDHEVHTFEDATSCIKQLHLNPNIISIDYTLPDLSGEKLLEKIHLYNKDIKVIVLSGQKDISTAVGLLKKGASDYITKDEETQERLLNTVNLLKENTSLISELSTLKEELSQKFKFDKSIIGNCDRMLSVYNLLERAVMNDITISITGETGTGKEVVAKAIHYNSSRKKGRFVAINMSAIPSELLESELFGHEKGAFTGALARKLGKFELANNGTLFLDEIGDLDLHLQAKLLRALQEREITRVGGDENIKFNCRVIIATHKDISEEVRKGNFREDLYYRILGLPIELPPLRDRGNDIILLAEFFLNEFVKQNPKRKGLKLSTPAKNKLLKHKYPGNVRELKAVIELAAVLSTENKISADAIQFRTPNRSMDILDSEMTMKEYTRKIIYHYLSKYKNVITAASKLDIGKSTIYKILKEDKELNELLKQ